MIRKLYFVLALILGLSFNSCTNENEGVDWTEEKVIEISSEIAPINIFGSPSEV